MKKFLSILLCFTAFPVLYGQQLTSSSFHELYGVLHNPATTGGSRVASVGGDFRTLWAGMPGGPKTAFVFGNTYLQDAKVGLGGYLYSDITGPTKRQGLQLSYAYFIPLSDQTKFSIGLEARGQQFSFDQTKLAQSLGSYDPAIAGSGPHFKGDAGVGLALTNEKWQVGASASQIVQSKLHVYEGSGNPTEEARLYRHYYLHGTYSFPIDEATKFTSHALVIYLPNAPVEVQGGGRMEHQGLLWYGLAWRYRQSWMISAGIRIAKNLNLGYSFDLYTSPLSIYDKGSTGHEVMLRYDFIK